MSSYLKLRVLLLFTVVAVICTSNASAKIITYSVPANETINKDYIISINGKNIDAYLARTLDEPFAGKKWDHGGAYSFAYFDMNEKVTVRITSSKSMRNTVILPKSAAIQPKFLDDHTITFILNSPKKLSIEPSGKKHPLLLFANSLENDAPKQEDPNVIYFGPGIHKPGKITLGSNQTLYLAGGAVVKGQVLATGNNLRICGRGILDGSDWYWKNGPVKNMIDIRNSKNIEISGIIIRGAPHWGIVSRSSSHLTINNVKICNSRVQNDDGIDLCNSQDVLISDCFIRSDDDCIALKGIDRTAPNTNVERVTIENCILWCDRARIFLLGHESKANYMRDIILKNIDIIHFSMTPFLLEPGEEMQLNNVLVEDIRINGEAQQELIRLRPTVNVYMQNKVPGHIKGVHFRNLKVEGQTGNYMIRIEGADSNHAVQDIFLEGIIINKHMLKANSETVIIGSHVKNVKF